VWKFGPLVLTTEQTVKLPRDAEMLTVDIQDDTMFLWALCEPENALVPRTILIYGTGHFVGEIVRYINSFQLHDGALVFHVFEGSR
jgi:hypothetical protein